MTRLLVILLAVVQVLDIVIHAASDQLEPIRVLANGLVLAWVALAFVRQFDPLTRWTDPEMVDTRIVR